MTDASDTLANTLAERGSRYGAFSDHAMIAQSLQTVMRGTDSITTGWDYLAPDMAQALTVIADKIARILNGDPTYLDNWHDIQGYARLVEQRLIAEQNPPASAPHRTDATYPGRDHSVSPRTSQETPA